MPAYKSTLGPKGRTVAKGAAYDSTEDALRVFSGAAAEPDADADDDVEERRAYYNDLSAKVRAGKKLTQVEQDWFDYANEKLGDAAPGYAAKGHPVAKQLPVPTDYRAAGPMRPTNPAAVPRGQSRPFDSIVTKANVRPFDSITTDPGEPRRSVDYNDIQRDKLRGYGPTIKPAREIDPVSGSEIGSADYYAYYAPSLDQFAPKKK